MDHKYSCDNCGYSTDRLDALKRHHRKKNPCRSVPKVVTVPEEVESRTNPLQCPCCERLFSTKYYAQKHIDEKKCTKMDSLQCPTCLLKFVNAVEKHKHKMSRICVLPPIVSVVNPTTVAHSENVVIDFMTPNLNAVIQYFLGNPSNIVAAYNENHLQEEIFSQIYYKGLLSNRSIVRIESKGAFVHVVSNGMKRSIPNSVGLLQTLLNVRHVANHQEIMKLLDPTKDEIIPHPDNMTSQEVSKLMRLHKQLIMLNGDYQITKVREPEYPDSTQPEPSVPDSTPLEPSAPDPLPSTAETSTASSSNSESASNSEAASDSEQSTSQSLKEGEIPPPSARRGAKGGRRPPSKAIRQHIHDLQAGLCNRCGTKLLLGWHADHIIPLFQNGTNDPSNLQGLCPPCHVLKSACELSGTPLPECIKKEDPMMVILNEVRELRQEVRGRVAHHLTERVL